MSRTYVATKVKVLAICTFFFTGWWSTRVWSDVFQLRIYRIQSECSQICEQISRISIKILLRSHSSAYIFLIKLERTLFEVLASDVAIHLKKTYAQNLTSHLLCGEVNWRLILRKSFGLRNVNDMNVWDET